MATPVETNTPDFQGSENQMGAALQPRPMAGAISAWTSQPENRAALIQAGIQLLQPIAPGQTFGGHVGQAIGAGAEARDTALTAQQAQRNAEVEQANESARTAAYAEATRTTAQTQLAGKPLTAYQLAQLSNAQQRIVVQKAKARYDAQESRAYTPGLQLKPEEMKTYEQILEEELQAIGMGGAPAASGGVLPPPPTSGGPTLADTVPAQVPTEQNAKMPDGSYVVVRGGKWVPWKPGM